MKDQLMRPVEAGRIVHAQLFAGPEGTGKRSAALLAARAMNCAGTGERPCNACSSCLQFLSGNSPRLIRVSPEKNAIRVDAIRALVDMIHVRPGEGILCVLIEDADRMNESAQNALLKTLEEVPDYCAFFLITDKPGALLPTIRSRCALVRFALLSERDTYEALAQAGVDEVRAQEAAREGMGSVGRALAHMNDEGYQPLKHRALDALAGVRKESDVAAAFQKIQGDKDQAKAILEIYEGCAARLMRARAQNEPAEEGVIARIRENGVRGEKLLESAIACAKMLNANVSFQSAMEMLFFDMARQEDGK